MREIKFALRDFNNGAILQRRIFNDLKLPMKTDEEFLSATAATNQDTLETIQRKISVLEKVADTISKYQKRILRHINRLGKYLRAIEQKGIVDTSADIDALREKYEMARKLTTKYTDVMFLERNPNDKHDEQPITVFYSKEMPAKKILDGIYVGVSENLRELYKAERNYYRRIFAERLKAARKAAGLTQTELGKITGIPRRNISDYEGTIPFEPNLSNLAKFAQTLNKPVGWFLGVN